MSSATPQPLSDAEFDELRERLVSEQQRMIADLAEIAADVQGLIRDSGDGSGDDLADVGNKVLEREQDEYSTLVLAQSLAEVEHALARMTEGTYGECEKCGGEIGILRLRAFPRATWCMSCKVAAGG